MNNDPLGIKALTTTLPLLLLLACGTNKPVSDNPLTTPNPISLEDIYRPYSYEATVVDVYDGDTYTLEFEIGFGLTFEDVIRVARIDTPELRGEEKEEGKKVAAYVEKIILDKKVIVKTDKDDRGKYGRLLTEIYYLDFRCDCWINLSDHLLEKGMAKLYE